MSPHPYACGCVVDAAHYTPVSVVAGEDCAEYRISVGSSASGIGAGPERTAQHLAAAAVGLVGPASVDLAAAAAVGLVGSASVVLAAATTRQIKNNSSLTC